MAFESFSFLALALLSVSLLRLCPPGWQRGLVLCAANAVFLASFVSTPLEILPVLAFVGLGYGATIVASRFGRSSLPVLVVGLVAIFAWLKQYSVIADLPPLHFAYTVIGLSYLLFRLLQIVIAVAQGGLRVPGILSYLNYTLFFLTLVAGPVQRYQNFREQMANPPVAATSSELNSGLGRVLHGYFYLVVLNNPISAKAAELKLTFYTAYAQHAWFDATQDLAAAALVYFVFLYINFAGYMHVVIGLGRLSGFHLPENFDSPYKATNFLEFWKRWHITVSEWLRSYLFNPLLAGLMKRWASVLSGTQLAGIAFFLTFFVMGMWHGTSIQFLVCGLVLGIAATVNKVWQTEVARRLGRQGYRALCRRYWYVHLARGLTLAYMAMALVCVWIGPAISPAGVEVAPAPQLASIEGMLCIAGALVLLTVAIGLAGPMVQLLASVGSTLARALTSRPGIVQRLSHLQPNGLLAWNATKVFTIAVLALVLNWTADIVYKGF